MSEPAIKVTELSYRYRGEKHSALDSINLTVERGEFLVVMGASEAGKSTLAACITALSPIFIKDASKERSWSGVAISEITK